MRRKIFFTVISFLLLGNLASFSQEAEDSNSKNKSGSLMTVEEAYLNSIEGVMIREMVAAEGRDSKLVALQYIQEAVDNGRISPEVVKALDNLATIGLSTVMRENGRVMNNYPDIRMKACELLGKLGTKEAASTLVKVMYADNEPSVITSAVRSLGQLGFNDGDETIDMINWINRKFDIINPTSSLALEVLNTYEKLAPKVENKKAMIEGIMRIASNYSYVTPVREKALEVLKMISNSNK